MHPWTAVFEVLASEGQTLTATHVTPVIMQLEHTQAPLIDLRNVSRGFSRGRGKVVVALRDVSLKIYEGEYVCIQGPSGSGKSTLLNILGCLDRPSSGEYLFDNCDTGALTSDELAEVRRKTFGFVFQSYNLLMSATAQENVELPAAYDGWRRARRFARASALLKRLGLGARSGHRPNALSGGEQQRVAMARALMNGGRVILADEPTGALDSKNTTEVMTQLAELSRLGHTLIVITHDPEVAAWADRRIELRDGQVVQDVAPSGRRGERSTFPETQPAGAQIHDERQSPVSLAHEAISNQLRSLSANLLRGGRVRTALTIMGVALGIWSVVALLAIVQGGYQQSLMNIARAGADAIYISPLHSGRAGDVQVHPVGFTMADVEAIRTQVGDLRDVVGEVTRSGKVRYGDKGVDAEIFAADARVSLTKEWPVKSGVFIDRDDALALRPVVVLGAQIDEELAVGSDSLLGEHVQVDGAPFLVKGVMSRLGEVSNIAIDPRNSRVFVPLATAQALLFGTDQLNRIRVHVEDPMLMAESVASIRDVLIRRHGSSGFHMMFQDAKLFGFSRIQKLLSALIGAVGAISLFFGAVGVSSLMLIAVTERTREIGIRMASGARKRDILRQFLLEAVTVTAMGGVLGVIFGVASGYLLVALGIPSELETWFVVVALASAFVIGLLAGILPAWRAASLDPVAALAR